MSLKASELNIGDSHSECIVENLTRTGAGIRLAVRITECCPPSATTSLLVAAEGPQIGVLGQGRETRKTVAVTIAVERRVAGTDGGVAESVSVSGWPTN